MLRHDIIAIGSSAGGVEAPLSLCAALPAALLVVQHVSPTSRALLPKLLCRAQPLPARHAVDGETVVPGTIYGAPPDLHMLVEGNHILLRHGHMKIEPGQRLIPCSVQWRSPLAPAP